MRLGLIARADNRGLGIQLYELYRHLPVAKTMVVDCPSGMPLPKHPERFPGATVLDHIPTGQECRDFLDGVDVVFTAETPYNYDLFRIAAETGVRSVLQFNYEFLDYLQNPHLPPPTVLASPSSWHYDELSFTSKIMLPVPIATEHFRPKTVTRYARRFLHIVGRPAIRDRNGTADLLRALRYITADVEMTIRCQVPGYVAGLIDQYDIRTPDNVTLILDTGDTVNYWDNYDRQDVLVMPRRFGGLCLPMQEALAAGMPVIMPDIAPNNDGWLPMQWLVPARKAGDFMARTMIDVYETDLQALAAKIDEFTGGPLYRDGVEKARYLAADRSWASLLPLYGKILAG